jgi:hypothetical protein
MKAARKLLEACKMFIEWANPKATTSFEKAYQFAKAAIAEAEPEEEVQK